jgi:hypothetical protein
MAESAPYPDEVTPGDPTSPVGLCTLWTPQERVLRGVPRELYALCGNLYSLWGISVLVRGVLARPTLRYLVVCGVDYADTGRALVALMVQGLTADGTLPGTTVHLADDLDAAALGRFRAQVSVVDLRGCTDAARVAAAIRDLPPRPPLGTAISSRLLAAGWTPPPLTAPVAAPQAAASASPTAEGTPTLPASPRAARPRQVGDATVSPDATSPVAASAQAPPASSSGDRDSASPRVADPRPGDTAGQSVSQADGRFQPDPRGNFLIAVGGGQIVAAHATTLGGPTGARFVGRTAAEVYHAILAAGLVSQLDHAAYLGAELARAEVAVRLGIPSRQDRPLALAAR